MFAVHETYKERPVSDMPKFKVIRATKQVVNGLKYELTVEIQESADSCIIMQFGVWSRGGTGPDQTLLVEKTPLNDMHCERYFDVSA